MFSIWQPGHDADVQWFAAGGGKTAVISPLLVLLLANGKQLVVQCVPGALLQQTRDKMRVTVSNG